MPLLDHFHPPLTPDHHWESFHSNWATRIADRLNEVLPAEFFAEEFTHANGRLEIDVATFEDAEEGPAGGGESATATLSRVWTPPSPPLTVPLVFPDTFEVRVYQSTGGRALVGAVELVSPGNEDRLEQRRAFVAKCASYLHQGVSLVVVDIVTSRRANLHDELLEFLGSPEARAASNLYAVAYRPVERNDQSEMDVWPESLAVGASLPTLPLRLTGDTFVPVELEATYAEACRRRRLPAGDA